MSLDEAGEASKAAPRFDESLDGTGLRVAIAAAKFNESIVGPLVDGAYDGLSDHAVADDEIDIVWVPGAFELPLAAQWLADSGHYDAVICLGAVIRGDTPHFDYVAGHAAHGIGRVSLDTGVPVVFGVLTTNTVEQAVERAAPDRGNKGYESAQVAIHMATLLHSLPGGEPAGGPGSEGVGPDGAGVEIRRRRAGRDQVGEG